MKHTNTPSNTIAAGEAPEGALTVDGTIEDVVDGTIEGSADGVADGVAEGTTGGVVFALGDGA